MEEKKTRIEVGKCHGRLGELEQVIIEMFVNGVEVDSVVVWPEIRRCTNPDCELHSHVIVSLGVEHRTSLQPATERGTE